MGVLLGGVFLILFIMAVVMVTPLIYYLKCDRAWLTSDRSRENWYRATR